MKKIAKWISVLSLAVGLTVAGLCAIAGREALTAGIGMSLGMLGIPSTFFVYWLLDRLASANSHGVSVELEAMAVTAAFILQWQVVSGIVWILSKRYDASSFSDSREAGQLDQTG